MYHFISRFLIPVLTFLVSGTKNWFTLNFSVIHGEFPGNVLLIVWAMVVGDFYHTFSKQAVMRATPYLNAKTEMFAVDISVFLLFTSVLFPYRPSTAPLQSFLHLITAFSATVLFFLAITAMDLRLYVMAPDLFALPTALLVAAICISIGLLVLCDFLITSALEIFLTLFSCFWLTLFDRKLFVWVRRKRMYFRV